MLSMRLLTAYGGTSFLQVIYTQPIPLHEDDAIGISSVMAGMLGMVRHGVTINRGTPLTTARYLKNPAPVTLRRHFGARTGGRR